MRKLLASCSVVLLAVGLLAACGGSSGGSSKASDNTTPAGGSPGGGSSNDAFSKLVADAAKESFKITFTSASGDSTTYAQDGNGNSSYNSGDTQVFSSSSGTVSCDTPAGGTATCTQLPGAGIGANPFLGFYSAGKTYLDALGDRGDKSTKSIAGRTAQCVSFSAKDLTGAALNGSAEYCIDKSSGVLLEIKTTDASGKESDEFTVTKYEEPSDSDFTPPATPKTIPSVSLPSGVTYPSGITIPGGG